MFRLVASVGLIFISLCLGYFYRLHYLRPQDTTNHSRMSRLMTLRDLLQFVAFFIFIPVAALLSLWGMPQPDHRLLCLPCLGLAAWILGGAFSLLAAKLLHYSRAATGSLFCCGTFTNIGAVGTLCCVIFLGEASIAYAALYRLCEELVYYGLAIPIASRYKDPSTQANTVQGFKISRLLPLIILALGLGLTLNLLGVPRPDVFAHLAALLSIAACSMALFAIGLGLRLGRLLAYGQACGIIMLLKFALIPFCIITLAYFLGLGHIDNGLPLQIIAVLASMPVAMNALLPPALLKLDLDLANACFISSTLALAFVLPWLVLVLLPKLGA